MDSYPDFNPGVINRETFDNTQTQLMLFQWLLHNTDRKIFAFSADMIAQSGPVYAKTNNTDCGYHGEEITCLLNTYARSL